MVTSQRESVSSSEGEYLLTWSTLTLYPVVEYVILHSRGWAGSRDDGWSRVVLPELCLPRHNKVYGTYRSDFRLCSDS